MQNENRFDYLKLVQFATEVLTSAGLNISRSGIVARTLVASDLMGHTTHGLQLLWPYANQLLENLMTKDGEPKLISDSGAAVTWDGNHLPGPYLVEKAIDLGLERLQNHPVFTLAIQKSHHIACLAAYLEKVTDRKKIIILGSSDPGNKTVAPFGGVTGTYSPDPLSYGIPTQGDPILFDSSASTLANGQVMQRHAHGQMLDGAWLMRADGSLSDDPSAFFADPPATILPVGGLTLGFKGFGYGILMEALTSGLAGSGRKEHSGQWSASIFLQLIDPAQFAGTQPFINEMQHLVDQCKASELHPHFAEIRMPGERALAMKRKQQEEGVVLHPEVIKGCERCAEKFAVSFDSYFSN
ncbi:MAG: Ldh family oxidoreductase [Saprospiraceae bacterium]|nr:Ldh family oxidoreductase [Saprospiraceae bacterium]